MAGTMPHAVFVETDLDGDGTSAAYAAELPGCATYAASPENAVAAIPARVNDFVSWLTRHGEPMPSFAGGNWYEVERAPAHRSDGQLTRAAFSLDELPPSDAEFVRYLRWLELAREELAEALDRADLAAATPAIEAIEAQDRSFLAELGGAEDGGGADGGDPIDRLFAARERLTELLEAAGGAGAGVRRMIRLAIAEDLRAADALRGATVSPHAG